MVNFNGGYKMIQRLNVSKDEVTREALGEYLARKLFYDVRGLRSSSFSNEVKEKLCDALDGAPDGHLGVQLLYSELMGTGYDLVTKEDGTRDYVKREPGDIYEVYEKTNELIDYLNELTGATQTKQPGDQE